MKEKTPKLPKAYKTKPEVRPIFSKTATNENDKPVGLDAGNLKNISNSISEKIKNNENITQLFPDTELAIQILTSSIISPNDMLTPSLIYKAPELSMPSDINSYIITTISNYINNEHNLLDNLNTILREALFTKGAYVSLILSDNLVNKTIESGEITLESIDDWDSRYENKGYLGSHDGINISTEEFSIPVVQDITIKRNTDITFEDMHVDIIDDPSILNLNKQLLNKLTADIEANVYGDLSSEDSSLDILFKTNKNNKPIVNLIEDDTNSENKYKPLIMKLSVESVIPVHVTGDPSKHLGYFILLDESGTPLTSKSINTFEIKAMENNREYYASDIKSSLINKAKKALEGITSKTPMLNNIEDIYTKVVSNVMKEKLANGMYGQLAEVADDMDLYRVMFARALKNMKTRILYVPKENVAYYAFDYRENGTGKSMLEKVSMLYSIRAILLFSTLMGNLKNNVTTTEVSAELDDNDPDPEATIEKIKSEILKTRQTQIPIGVTKIDDLVDWSHKVGFKYNFTHPALPEMKIDVSETNSSKIIPDTELDDKIQEYIIMSFGLTKEMVMAGYDPEFATTVLSNNILLAKRVMRLQEQFSVMLTSHVNKLIMSDPIIKNSIKDIVKNNLPKIMKYLKKHITDEQKDVLKTKKKEDIVTYITNNYIKNMKVTLPKPAMQEAQNNKEALDNYIDVIDTFLDVILSSDAFPSEIIGDFGDKMDIVKTVIKTVLVKDWMMDNNYIPEISNFFTLDDDGKPIFNILDEYKDYVDKLSATVLPFFKDAYKTQFKTDDVLEKMSEEPDEEEEDDRGDTEENVEEGNENNEGEEENDEENNGEEDNGEEETEGDNAEEKEDDENLDLDKL